MENEAIDRISESEKCAIDEASLALRSYTQGLKSSLSSLVAALCDVDEHSMLCEPRTAIFVQARWLYWYALKQMFGETNDRISKMSKKNHYFKTTWITKGITKMSMLIQVGTIWTRRWAILKRVIGEVNNVEQTELFQRDITVRITHPKGVNVEIKQV